MTNSPLAIALLWHMHQPFYKDLITQEYVLPWVRLHAIKDYYDMVAILDKFPEVKVNFNLVPSLLLQIEDYINHKDTIKEKCLDITKRDPKDLSLEDRIYILKNFFMANWDNMIKPYPRYYDLLLKRGRFISKDELEEVAPHFSAQEILDLQVWFNLAWFGFIYKNEDPVIKELIKKGKYFSQEDKMLVIDKQWEIMRMIIPKYRELEDRGQIEISTTPFYHPILPLLCDSDVAKDSFSQIKLPRNRFQHPEDAIRQIEAASQFHAERFGKKPQGMWPSEGSVSECIIPLMAKTGIQWMATDEGILERSIQRVEQRTRTMTAEDLCQPYRIEKEGCEVSAIFRNHFLSDQIGFVYYRFRIEEAIADFNSHLKNIRLSLPDNHKKYLVSVILDEENAWEYYSGGGKPFLEAFYKFLASNPDYKTVRVSDYLAENPPEKKLNRLFPGSWINSNFRIWIGHEEDNQAWDYLSDARAMLEQKNSNEPLAWQEIYIAEGSDWCWWYGDDHSSDNDEIFDALFRKHLKNAYSLVNERPPADLDIPIKRIRFIRPLREPVYLINPVLDGKVTNYYEWLSAGYLNISGASGAMHQTTITVLDEIYYGFNMKNLFLRLGFNFDLSMEEMKYFSYGIIFYTPVEMKAEIGYDFEEQRYIFKLYQLENKNNWQFVKCFESFGLYNILEMAIPFADIGAKPCSQVEFVVVVYRKGCEIERWPTGRGIVVTMPSDDYESNQWFV